MDAGEGTAVGLGLPLSFPCEGSLSLFWLFVLLVGAALLLWNAHRRISASRREVARQWDLAEFAGKRLLYSEQLFRAPQSRLVAKVDRAYEAPGDDVELLELKTRPHHRVYRSDVIEMSAQRVAVEEVDGRRVLDTAFVLTESTRDGSRRLHRIQLMERAAVLAFRDKRLRLLRGEIRAEAARVPALCNTCAYAKECTVKSTAAVSRR